MKRKYSPFLVNLSGQSSPSLIWATDEAHAWRLLHQQTAAIDNEAIITKVENIILPDEMLAMLVPEQLKGKLVDGGKNYEPGFIVPDFLSESRTAVIYTRVSTPQQAKNTSLECQHDDCKAFARASGLSVVQTYSEVKSGELYEYRPLLQKALDDLEAGRADTLLVAHHDRLSRGEKALSEIHARVQQCGAHIIMVWEQIPQSPDHSFTNHLSISIHQFKLDLAQEWGLLATA